jgi:hypothetical protein
MAFCTSALLQVAAVQLPPEHVWALPSWRVLNTSAKIPNMMSLFIFVNPFCDDMLPDYLPERSRVLVRWFRNSFRIFLHGCPLFLINRQSQRELQSI